MVAKIIIEECVACGLCEDACPTDAIIVEDIAVVDEDECLDCESCIDECPSVAIFIE